MRPTFKKAEKNKMLKKFYKLILFNYRTKGIFARVFFSPLIQTNPIYKKILRKRIKKVSNLYKDKPYCIKIENTNICNARCIMCPRDQMKRTMGFMLEDIYKKIVNEAVELGVGFINLHNFGEPLLDPHFCEKVVYAKEKGIKTVSTNSNGSVLTKEMSKKLIDSGLDKLFISIDAATKESYERVRVGLKYDMLIENIRNFVRLRKQLKKKKPEIIVNFVTIKENKNEIKKFIKIWKNIVDHTNISFSHDWAGDKKDIEIYNSQNFDPCRLLWTELTIAWNGDYLLCCQDYDGQIVLDNIKDKTIKEIWQSEKFQYYRKKQLTIGRKGLPLCENCKLNTFWWF